MSIEALQPGPTETEWVASQQRWTQGWRRTVFPGVFLVYLVQVVGGVSKDSHGAGAVVGYVIVGVFCADYLLTLPQSWHATPRRFWIWYASLVALSVAEIPFAHADAFVMWVFIVVVTVARLGGRSAPIVGGLALLSVLMPDAIHSWHDSFATAIDNGTAITIPMVGLAMFGFFQVLHGNRALAEARSELARLAAENERSRIARDLHDLLGHSLTTITVKSSLARRIAASDPSRAFAEIAEIEAIARRSLADVRAAVTNYRKVTLAGELATGKELLRAAGIVADFPTAVEVVDSCHQELFGWVLREGLTNVVRHAHARTCSVRISSASVEIIDDGVGGAPLTHGGLAGLRERVTAAGGTVDVGPLQPNGWRLLVYLASEVGSYS